jgi:hypothetical protein
MAAPNKSSGLALAVVLCAFLTIFMVAEVAHDHSPSGTLQHNSCLWCLAAHTATIPILALPAGPSVQAEESVLILESAGNSLFLIPLPFIRPPPNSFQGQE